MAATLTRKVGKKTKKTKKMVKKRSNRASSVTRKKKPVAKKKATKSSAGKITPRAEHQILVTGSGGRLGSEIRKFLLNDDDVSILHSTRETMNLRNFEQVRDTIVSLRPDAVINTAAITDGVRSELSFDSRQRCWEVNAQAVDNLVKICAVEGIPLIHVSDADVFALPPTRIEGYRENDPVGACNCYGSSKIAGELAMMNVGQTMLPEIWDSHFRYWLVRTGTLFGGQESHVSWPELTRARLRTKRSGELMAPTDAVRSFTYTPHLAQALVWIAKHTKELVSGVYHVANQGHASYYEMARHIAIHTANYGFKVRASTAEEFEPNYALRKDYLPRFTALNCDKWNDVAPFKIPHWREAVAEWLD